MRSLACGITQDRRRQIHWTMVLRRRCRWLSMRARLCLERHSGTYERTARLGDRVETRTRAEWEGGRDASIDNSSMIARGTVPGFDGLDAVDKGLLQHA